MKNRAKVLIYAYCRENLGDDLFLHHLLARYPKTEFILFAPEKYRRNLAAHRNIRVLDEASAGIRLLKHLRLFERWKNSVVNSCGYAVYIGGSIFMEYEQWKNQHQWYRTLFPNDRLFFLGCNWGPCKTDAFKANMTGVLRKMRDVCFRDRYSYNEFSRLPNIRYAPDILFGMSFADCHGMQEQKQVFISVIDCESKTEEPNALAHYAENYRETVLELIRYYTALQYHIVLASFCAAEKDDDAIQKIMECLQEEQRSHVRTLGYHGTNAEELLRELCASEIVVGTRFHAVVLGIAAGKKVLPIIYSDKTKNLLNDLEFEGIRIDLRDEQKVDIGCIVPKIGSMAAEQIESLRKQAGEHFRELDFALECGEKNG